MDQPCEHLKNLTEANFASLRPPIACEECLKEGTRWVSLRECMKCGHVGCCDSSPGKHATKHFHKTAVAYEARDHASESPAWGIKLFTPEEDVSVATARSGR